MKQSLPPTFIFSTLLMHSRLIYAIRPVPMMVTTSVEEAKSFLQKAFKGKLGLMINTMIKEEAISQEDLDELYEILEKGKAEE